MNSSGSASARPISTLSSPCMRASASARTKKASPSLRPRSAPARQSRRIRFVIQISTASTRPSFSGSKTIQGASRCSHRTSQCSTRRAASARQPGSRLSVRAADQHQTLGFGAVKVDAVDMQRVGLRGAEVQQGHHHLLRKLLRRAEGQVVLALAGRDDAGRHR